MCSAFNSQKLTNYVPSSGPHNSTISSPSRASSTRHLLLINTYVVLTSLSDARRIGLISPLLTSRVLPALNLQRLTAARQHNTISVKHPGEEDREAIIEKEPTTKNRSTTQASGGKQHHQKYHVPPSTSRCPRKQEAMPTNCRHSAYGRFL